MTDPYRAAREHDDRIASAEPEVVLDRPARERNASFVRLVCTVAIATAVGLALVPSGAMDFLVIGGAVIASTVGAARIRAKGRVVFRIDRDALVIVRAREEESVPLHTLDDVELETREVRKVGHDANPIMGLNFNQTVGPAVDLARVTLVVRKRAPLLVSDEWLSHTEASEAFRRLRLFLRARGWLPRGERGK